MTPAHWLMFIDAFTSPGLTSQGEMNDDTFLRWRTWKAEDFDEVQDQPTCFVIETG